MARQLSPTARPGSLAALAKTGPRHPEIGQPPDISRRPQGRSGPHSLHKTGRPSQPSQGPQGPGSASQIRQLAKQGQPAPLTLPFTPSARAKQPSSGRPGPTSKVGQVRRRARHRAQARPLALEIARLPARPPAWLPTAGPVRPRLLLQDSPLHTPILAHSTCNR